MSDQENRRPADALDSEAAPPREAPLDPLPDERDAQDDAPPRADMRDDDDDERPRADVRDDDHDVGDDGVDDDSARRDDEVADDAEPAGPISRRPPLIVIVGSALLLVAIGIGLGTLIPSGPPPEPPVPTVAALPTALPLPAAIGEASSSEPIVRVGEVEIPRGDFVRLYQPGANPQELLDQLVMRELVVQAASSEGVQPDDAAVTAQVDELKQNQAEGDATKFTAFLTDNGIGSEENLRRLIGRDLLIEQMVLRHTMAEQAHARHILLAATAEEADGRKAEAEDLLKQIEGGADFAALAQEKSEDSGSQATGGDLGWAPRGAFVGPFDEAVFSMKVGEVRLVQSEFGWHIIELLDAPAVRPFEKIELLSTPTGQQAFQESFLPWADKLKADAEAANRIEMLVETSELVADPAQS